MALPSSMAEALRLTRAGNLAEATARLRDMLPGLAAAGTSTTTSAPLGFDAARFTGRFSAATPPTPADTTGLFEARRHVGSAGALDYMLYRPLAAAPGLPLVIMLHGCTQTPEDFARGTAMNRLADELGFLVAYPRQTQAANAQKCWNWFRPGDQHRDGGEAALIAGVARDVIAAEQADAGRVYVAGLSAGGAAAANLAAAYPDLFAAVGIHSGLSCGVARDLPSALTAMRQGARGAAQGDMAFVPVITFHGDRDGTVHEVNARDIVGAAERAAKVSLRVETESSDAGGRSYTRAVYRDAQGRSVIEQWTIAGAGHAWSGGDASGSYADASGPDASRAMLRFFLDQDGRKS
ncbi:PHB depolymerase family esterase [Sphingomonas sp.]|uniref:extracellular catalytic domain type 1 short-chain-length polyhydroxyalkanoate depolymerase n=1 Tax=Sphingomonas sp. TaxID=28214 RepID=UPI002D7EE566|nr:PHB depolymerase family esterase [Sphingomonas sp.]HEU0043261.1 PHB depolymerase family esterase [Sphingomonas sp.]